MDFLNNRNILLGITGSIAAYKSAELARLFIKAGANVRVIMSEDAKRFITPLTFEAITGNEVLHVETESWSNDANHIHITKWAECFVIAPATANTINKLAQGFADNLLLQTALANTKPLLIAPAANTNMVEHPSTQNAITLLKERGAILIDPISKLLACKDEGNGALAEPDTIFWHTARVLLQEDAWQNKNAIITGGGTIEKIDDVRCLGNFSSGKMAEALSIALYLKGANVTLLSSAMPFHELLPITRESYSTSDTLEKNLQQHLSDGSILFMAAAVSDYLPSSNHTGKLKKENLGDTWNLELTQNKDILASIDKKNITSIGFKAEMDESVAYDNAKKMLEKKNLDAVCLNVLTSTNSFGSNHNSITFITKEKSTTLPLTDKLSLALDLVELAKEL